MNDLLDQYEERFGEFFPTEEFGGNIEETIKECLEKNIPVDKLHPRDYDFIY